MCISNQAGGHINKEIIDTAMTRMGNLRDVFKPIIDRFDNGPFAQEQLIHQGHEPVLLVLANAGNELNILFQKRLKSVRLWSYIATTHLSPKLPPGTLCGRSWLLCGAFLIFHELL